MKRLLSYQTWFQFFCYWFVLFFSYQVNAYSTQFYKVSETVGGGTATVLETGKIDTQDGSSGSVQVTLSTEGIDPDIERFDITPTDTNMANTDVKQLAVERDKSKSKQAIWLSHLLEQQPTTERLASILTGQKLFFPVPRRATEAAQLSSVSALIFDGIHEDSITASLLKCTNCNCDCATKSEGGEYFCAECPACCGPNASEKAKKCTQCGCCLGIDITAKDCCEGDPKCQCIKCPKCECKVCPAAGDAKPVCPCCEGDKVCRTCAPPKLTCAKCDCIVCPAPGDGTPLCSCCKGGDKCCTCSDTAKAGTSVTTCSKCSCTVCPVCPVAGDEKPLCSCCEGGGACSTCEQKVTCTAGAGATITILLSGGKAVKSFQVQLPTSKMNPKGKTITVEYSMSSFKQPNATEPVAV